MHTCKVKIEEEKLQNEKDSQNKKHAYPLTNYELKVPEKTSSMMKNISIKLCYVFNEV